MIFVLTDINCPQRLILPFSQFFNVSPDIVSRQIDVFPAHRRQVLQQLLIDMYPLPLQQVNVVLSIYTVFHNVIAAVISASPLAR